LLIPPVISVSPDWYFFGVSPKWAPTARDQLADPRREPAPAHLAELQPEPAQDAANTELHVQELALQKLAPDQQGPDLLRRRRLAVHGAVPTHPQQLGDAAGVLAIVCGWPPACKREMLASA